MSLPRWRAIIKLFPLRGIARIASLLIITAAALGTTVSRFAPYIYRHQSITTTAVFLGVTGVIAYVFRRWYVERSTLSESEHYILLVMLAAYTSLVFGFLNYGLYRSNHRAFLVAKDFQDAVFSENMAEVEGRIAA